MGLNELDGGAGKDILSRWATAAIATTHLTPTTLPISAAAKRWRMRLIDSALGNFDITD